MLFEMQHIVVNIAADKLHEYDMLVIQLDSWNIVGEL
jgi:hypothetical protein